MVCFARYVLGLGFLCLSANIFGADRFPERPVRMIVPFSAGGTLDIVARVLAQDLSSYWGQSVVVDNRVGAGGNIGNELAAQAAPDGHTLLANTAALTIAPSVYKKLSFDPLRDFVPISKVGFSPAVILVHESVRVNSISELIALAKAQPGKLNYGSSGIGGSVHLAMELFKSVAKVDITHIPYKGAAPAMSELMGGQIQVLLNAMGTGLALAKSGKVKVLAVTTAQRSPFAPDVPAVAESGAPYEFSYWYGIFAPSKTPRAIVTQLNADVTKVLETPATRKRLAAQGVTPVGNSLAQFAAEVKNEVRTWAEVVKASKIQPE
ncbi:MAG: tripartite tricarboxylate transporter substrate binding protein [Betaproteobacteria bacterium]|nr:tripartite tricarboxylate transporter substrate binding protein [Betaproteobacteria bacterium]MBI3054584.1 tripartite tricarboxylate transporter substrate binding protein [Betaproteobacteria bacterium]